MIAPLLPAFCKLHPQVEVELHLLDRFVDLVEEGFDVAIRLSDALPEGMVATKLADVRYGLRASPSLAGLAAARAPLDLENLPALRLAGRRAKEPWVLSRGEERVVAHPQGPVSANTSDALLSLAVSGMGVALLPDYVDAAAMARGELVAVLPEWEVQGPFGDAVWALRPERRALPKVAAFTEFLAQALRGRSARAPRGAQAATGALARAA